MKKKQADRILEIIGKYPDGKSAAMPALQLLQKENSNHLSMDDLAGAGKLLNVSKSKLYGIASYYTMFNIKPVGKYHLQVDTCIPAFLAGADEIVNHITTRLGIKPGETTDDGMFTLSTIQDLASCGTNPVIQVNDRYFENMTIEKTDKLIEAFQTGETPDDDKSMNVISTCNILLKNRLEKDALGIDHYRKNGGYKSLEKAIGMTSQAVADEVREAGVRGRGGAGFPAGMKWSFLPKNDDRPVYLICNADEGEPGTYKDRQIMEYDPHLLVEGIAISAYAINAKKAFIYIRGEFDWIADILEKAIEEASSDGRLAHVEIVVHRGGDHMSVVMKQLR